MFQLIFTIAVEIFVWILCAVTLINSLTAFNHLLIYDSFIQNFLKFPKSILFFFFSGLIALAALISLRLPRCEEKAMAPHSSTLAWKIPWTEEPGGLQSMGSLGVGHD